MAAEMTAPLNEKLLRRGRMPDGEHDGKTVPLSEIPMLLTLEQLRPNPDNPRTSRNPKYDEIKASIRSRGLDSVPKVTRDPECPDDTYIFSDGGNTRHAILSELYAETGDDRFRCIPCIVKPWPGRLHCVIGHLAENDLRGEISFIEKALGIEKARSLYETQLGREVSLRELAELLKNSGYPVHYSNISRMRATVEFLYPWMPDLLSSGIGRPQVLQLLALRASAEKAWQAFYRESAVPPEPDFTAVFGGVCRRFNNPSAYSAERFKAALTAAMPAAAPVSTPPETDGDPPEFAGNAADFWHIPALQDDIEHLQNTAFRLAYTLAETTGTEHTLSEDRRPESAGYAVSPVPGNELLAALCGDGRECVIAALIGSADPFCSAVCDDDTALQFLRLLRIIRRIRELQRQLPGEVCA